MKISRAFFKFPSNCNAEKESGAVGVAAEAAQLFSPCNKTQSPKQNICYKKSLEPKMSSFKLEESSKNLDEKIRLNRLISEIFGSV